MENYKRIQPEEISDEGALNLVAGIVSQAVYDWKKAVQNKARGTRMECERFFRSPWFTTLTGLDGKAALRDLKRQEGVK